MTSGGLAAVSASAFSALYSAFGKYDVVHIHAEGPAFFTWLPKMFGKRVVVAAMRYLNKQNIAPSIENYEVLYRGNLPEGKRSVPQAELLEQLYQKFNCARPLDYHGHSLSVSDVIMLNQDGKISAHYVDSIGFKELPGFLDKKPERLSVLQNLKEKCDAPECNPTVCRKVRDAHEL